MQRADVDVRCPALISLCLVETGSLTEPGVWLAASKPTALGLQGGVHSHTWLFICVQIFMVTQQMLLSKSLNLSQSLC